MNKIYLKKTDTFIRFVGAMRILGSPSVHGAAKVTVDGDRKVQLTGHDGIILEAITNVRASSIIFVLLQGRMTSLWTTETSRIYWRMCWRTDQRKISSTDLLPLSTM